MPVFGMIDPEQCDEHDNAVVIYDRSRRARCPLCDAEDSVDDWRQWAMETSERD